MAEKVVCDVPGACTMDEMRGLFEAYIAKSKVLSGNTPLGTVTVNGKFHHYVNSTTDTMWIGFALGVRVAMREELKRRAQED